jgi:hypothetical protein
MIQIPGKSWKNSMEGCRTKNDLLEPCIETFETVRICGKKIVEKPLGTFLMRYTLISEYYESE